VSEQVQQCQNKYKIKHQNPIKWQNWYPLQTNTWPLTFLAWYMG